jgi:hypothetical protein
MTLEPAEPSSRLPPTGRSLLSMPLGLPRAGTGLLTLRMCQPGRWANVEM